MAPIAYRLSPIALRECMRIVIFSDVHGNVVALERVVASIARDAAPDALVVVGDLVADGPRPAESLALLRSLSQVQFVMGNTDQNVLHEQDAEHTFTRNQLSADDLHWLEQLPFSLRIEAAPGHELLVVHANPQNLNDKIEPDMSPNSIKPLLQGVTEEIVAFGHHHVPFVREVEGVTLVDVASVGLPRDGVLRAVYAVLTWDGNSWEVAHHRVAFDTEAVAHDYQTVGYPQAEKAAKRFLKASY